MDMDEAIDLRSKFPHFRVLILGKANAGKTTLLKKVCDSIEEPEVYNPSGKKLDPAIIQGSSERGMHDIENQLVFKSNPKFIFHDSRGFEAGSLDEMQTVKSFITKRAGQLELSKQLHAIWYCFPTDTNRPVLDADKKFFQECSNRKVPVIAIFTKFDGLVTKAYSKLRKTTPNRDEATKKKLEMATEMLSTDFIEPLKVAASGPIAYVRLEDMRKKASDCKELINETANTLNNDVLKLFFVSVQQNNIDTCIRFSVRSGLRTTPFDCKVCIRHMLCYFPHVWRVHEYDKPSDDDHRSSFRGTSTRSDRPPPVTVNFLDDIHSPFHAQSAQPFHAQSARRVSVNLLDDIQVHSTFHAQSTQLPPGFTIFKKNADLCFLFIQVLFPDLVKVAPGGQSSQGLLLHAELVAVICICVEQTFVQASVKKQAFDSAFSDALASYVKSGIKDIVTRAVRGLVQGKDNLDDSLQLPLLDIIKKYRLRTRI